MFYILVYICVDYNRLPIVSLCIFYAFFKNNYIVYIVYVVPFCIRNPTTTAIDTYSYG